MSMGEAVCEALDNLKMSLRSPEIKEKLESIKEFMLIVETITTLKTRNLDIDQIQELIQRVHEFLEGRDKLIY